MTFVSADSSVPTVPTVISLTEGNNIPSDTIGGEDVTSGSQEDPNIMGDEDSTGDDNLPDNSDSITDDNLSDDNDTASDGCDETTEDCTDDDSQQGDCGSEVCDNTGSGAEDNNSTVDQPGNQDNLNSTTGSGVNETGTGSGSSSGSGSTITSTGSSTGQGSSTATGAGSASGGAVSATTNKTGSSGSNIQTGWSINSNLNLGNLDPDSIKYLLLTEMDGISFGITTDKGMYNKDDEIWATINAPANADVELMFTYDGINQYIKIPKDKQFPLRYLLPIPRNIGDGIYKLKMAVYYLGVPLKTETVFQIGEDVSSHSSYPSQETTYSSSHQAGDMDNDVQQVSQATLPQDIDYTPQGDVKDSDGEPIEGIALDEEKDVRQMRAEIGKPVKWVKDVTIANTDSSVPEAKIIVSIPKDAENVEVLDKQEKVFIQAQVEGQDVEISTDLDPKEEKTYAVQFETEAPKIDEDAPVETENEWKKEVKIYSDYHYQDVFSYTDIKETEQGRVRLYWDIDGVMTDVTDDENMDIRYYDTNNNGLIDKISWITPHLSTQTFAVVIILDPNPSSFEEGIAVTLESPLQDSFVKDNNVNFKFEVKHNSSLSGILCDLFVDGTPYMTGLNASSEMSLPSSIDLPEGSHTWYVKCQSSSGVIGQSSTWSFKSDYTAPAIALADSSILSLIDTVNLSFSVSDNMAQGLSCYVNISDNYPNAIGQISLGNPATRSILLTQLENGTYRWNVSCIDDAKNLGSSSTGTFFIDTKRNFSFTPNKKSYVLGETGYYVLTSPYGSEVTLLFTNPKSSSFLRRYTNKSLVIDAINFTQYPGTYSVEAVLSYNGAIKKLSSSFNVENSLDAKIVLNTSDAGLSDTIKFEAEASGGIGNVTYSWNMGDGSDLITTRKVEKKYSKTGSFLVTLTVTDSKGNTATAAKTVNIRDKMSLEITVLEEVTNVPVRGAHVVFAQTEKTTDQNGKVYFDPLYGEYDVYVRHPDYRLYRGIIFCDTNKSVEITIERETAEQNDSEVPASSGVKTVSETPAKKETVESEAKTPLEELKDRYADGSEEYFAEALSKVETAQKEVNMYRGVNRKVADLMGIESQLEKAALNLQRSNRDIFNLKINWGNKTEEENEEDRKGIIDSVASLEDSSILGIIIKESETVSIMPSDSDISFVSRRYLESHNTTFDDNVLKDYIDLNRRLNGQSVSFEYYLVEAEYLSGKKSTITLIVAGNITFPDGGPISFINYIPPEVLPDGSEMTFLGSHVNVLGSGIIEFIPNEGSEAGYYIQKELTSNDIKNIKALFLVNDLSSLDEKKRGILGITASTIFVKLSDMNIGDPKLFIEISLIVILLIVYLVYQFDLIEKIRSFSLFKMVDREIRDISSLMTKAYDYLDNHEIEKAEELHKGIMLAYTNLDKKKQDKIFKDTTTLFDEINIMKIRDIAKESKSHAKKNAHDVAKAHYVEIQEIYKRLSRKAKVRVVNECMDLFEELKKINEGA